ncbi:uncharacterized protein BKA78DRAFT_340266 [Phyllosticta capitalensis]|uniref:uncharacterized protein n=1 Tax=Phyllosticta capitalensis TaxID=121624 RepID=UPI00312E0DA8
MLFGNDQRERIRQLKQELRQLDATVDESERQLELAQDKIRDVESYIKFISDPDITGFRTLVVEEHASKLRKFHAFLLFLKESVDELHKPNQEQ